MQYEICCVHLPTFAGLLTCYYIQIIIPLDELPPHHIDRETLAASVDRSHRWEVRSLREHLKDSQDRQQAIYCVVHVRKNSLDFVFDLISSRPDATFATCFEPQGRHRR